MPSEDLIVALDAGSSSVRAVLLDTEGRMHRQASLPVPETATGAIAETDAAALLDTALSVAARLAAPAARVAAIGVTSALGLVLADREDRPLTPVIGWRDRRAVDEASALERILGAGHFYAVTGRRADPELVVAKLLWLQRHAPALMEAAAVAYSAKDWLVARLCGARATDPTSACYCGLYDVAHGSWSGEFLAALKLPPHLLPGVRGAADVVGGLTKSAAARIGLRQGTPVVLGGPDGTVGAIGVGLVRPGLTVDIMGTTDVVLTYVDTLPPTLAPTPRLRDDGAPGRLIVNSFPTGKAWCVGGPMLATGGALAWFAELLGSDVGTLSEAARNVPPGARGLLMSVALGGSRAPRWDPQERAGIRGLSFAHDRADIFRAALEAGAAEVADMFDAIDEAGVAIEEIRVGGGGAHSDLLLEIRAAMLMRPLCVPEVLEASALGAAMLACVGVGHHDDLSDASRRMVRIERRVNPDQGLSTTYAELRPRLASLRDALRCI